MTDKITASYHANISPKVLYQNVTNNKMNFDKQCQANKLSKMSIAIHFNLPHVCLSVPPFVFAVLFIQSFNVLSSFFNPLNPKIKI